MASRLNRLFNSVKNTGFGEQASQQGERFINKDGSFNVRKKGLGFFGQLSYYHELITMSWPNFLLVVFVAYVILNLFYAGLYWVIGIDQLTGLEGATTLEQFIETFYFSTQTFTTVGYGKISPVGGWAGFVAAVESLNGLMAFALITGLVYGRFARPVEKIIFSEKALIAPYRGGRGLMFRIVNARKNQLTEVEVQVIASMTDHERGNGMRKFYPLDLEINRINMFALSWTVVHPLSQDSPFFEMDQKALERSDVEVMILIKAFDDTSSQMIHVRSSYKYHDMVVGAKFVNMFDGVEGGMTTIDVARLGEFEKAILPDGVPEMQ